MVRSWSVVGLLTCLTLALMVTFGCSDDDTNQNNQSVCSGPADCPAGWQCVKQPGASEGLCVDPAAPQDGALPSPDGGPVDDQQVTQPDQGAPKQDKGLPPDKGTPKQDKGLPPDKGTPKQDKGLPPDKGTPKKCVANTSTCVGLGHYRKCNPTGSGFLPTAACPHFNRCENGACVKAGKVTGSLSATVQTYWQIFGGVKLKYSGGVGATFLYNAPTTSGYKGPPVGTCQYQSFGSSSSGKGVPFDAGAITLTGLPSGKRTISFNASKKGYVTAPAITNAAELFGQTLSFSSPGKNLIHGAFSGKLVVPPKRLLSSPAHNASHSKSAPLALKWSGATGNGELRVDLLDSTPTTSTYVTCTMKDTGSFTIPAAYLSKYTKNYPTTIVLIGMSSGTFTAKGMTTGYAGSAILAQSDIILK